jgi:hypothetical protein
MTTPSAKSARSDITSEAQDLGHGVICRWYNNRQIIAICAEDSSPAAVDLWVNKITDEIKQWPSGRPCLTLVDVSSKKIATTPYVRERAKGLIRLRNDLQMFTAMVLPPTFFAQIARIVTRAPLASNVQMRVFTTRDEALKWLQSKING